MTYWRVGRQQQAEHGLSRNYEELQYSVLQYHDPERSIAAAMSSLQSLQLGNIEETVINLQISKEYHTAHELVLVVQW